MFPQKTATVDLLDLEDVLDELLLQLLVCVVDQQLLEPVALKMLKSEDVEDVDRRAHILRLPTLVSSRCDFGAKMLFHVHTGIEPTVLCMIGGYLLEAGIDPSHQPVELPAVHRSCQRIARRVGLVHRQRHLGR